MKTTQREEVGGVHELLPWYVNGTLDPSEAALFAAHLRECSDCTRELELLESVSDETARHGEDLFDDHPSAEQLVAVARGTADAEGTSSVVRHARLCPTCAIEMGWIAGDVQSISDKAPRTLLRSQWLGWYAAAAVFAVALWAPWRAPSTPGVGDGVLYPQYVPEPARGAAHPTLALDASGRLTAYFTVDFPRDAYPVTVSLVASAGDVVVTYGIDGPEELAQELYSYLDCPAGRCAPGGYEIVLRPAGGESAEQRIPFDLAASAAD